MKFTRIDPQAAGIHAQNTLRDENIRNYLINGAGLTAGDWDNDGLPDLFLVVQDGPNRLYRQGSPWEFEDVTESAGLPDAVAWGCGAAFVDINGDGWLDIFVVNKGAPAEIHINNKDGTFLTARVHTWPDAVNGGTMAAFADYDRDGDLDLYLTGHRLNAAKDAVNFKVEAEKNPQTGRMNVLPPADEHYEILDTDGRILVQRGSGDILLRNDGADQRGSPKMTPVTQSAGMIADRGMGLGAVWWDANDDGWPDLYVANDFHHADHLWLNQKNGTFRDVLPDCAPYLSWFSMGCDFADVNGDGRFDFLSSDMAGSNHFRAKTMMGSMTSSAWFLDNLEPRQIMRNCLFVNTGNEADGKPKPFLETAFYSGIAGTDWTWSALFGDLDNDGWEDVYFTNGLIRNLQDPDAADRMIAVNEEMRAAGADKAALHRRIQDMTLALPKLDDIDWCYRNAGGLKFERVNAAWNLEHRSVSHGSVMCDMDRDGDVDLLVNTVNEPPLLLRNDSPPDRHSVLISLECPDVHNRFALGARILARCSDSSFSRILTSSRGYASGQEPVIHIGLGNFTGVEVLTIRWPDGKETRLTNLPADRHYHITTAAVSEPGVSDLTRLAVPSEELIFTRDHKIHLQREHREDTFDDFAKQELLPNQLSRMGPCIAVADADGNGSDDIFTGGASGQAGGVYLQKEPGGFAPTLQKDLDANAPCEDAGAVWFDADNDGDNDLVVAGGGNHLPPGDPLFQPRLYLNDGKARLTRMTDAFPEFRESCAAVAAVDVDRDGDVDVFIGGRLVPGNYPATPRSGLFLNDGTARFKSVPFDAPHMITAAVFTDVNNDAWPDLIAACEWGPVLVYLNKSGTLERAADAAPEGWWNGLAAGDVDGDGDIDLVATNFGLNTKYSASPEHPALLFAADFGGEGATNLVEAHSEGDRLVPVRGRSCSSHAMPFLKQKFGSYASFAQSSLEDIYSAEKLASAQKLKATELRSSVLFNDGQGKFTVSPLRDEAQLAPAAGLALEDFNGDGHLDLVLAEGFNLAQRETGRLNGGMSTVMLNDEGGTGNFFPFPDEKGLLWRADARSLAVLDLNGDHAPDLMLGVNNAAPLIALGKQNFSRTLRVKARSGRPCPPGVRIEASASKRTWIRESHCGTGCMTQNAFHWPLPPGIDKVRVRWPDGSTSEHTLDASCVVQQPD